ncbi:hypothetical protein OCA8868_01874 [Octadecabacter ascidiaceicola]|uniref:Uncharacterized protein n=1 Tax=Octadecabacter ascidiaceicola TaxID=1655543 RepID=A0A238K8E4_9RHOB|nr:hypothetical protein OCA8868_01874 [Octadecabacter ascidiaceicola]
MLVAGLTLATSAQSQPIIDFDAMPEPYQTVEIDLDGDGTSEVASAFTLNDRFGIVTIRPPETGGNWNIDAAFVVPINLSDFDTLEALPNGNLRIHWGCFACGRTHNHRSVTVDWRDDIAQVIGYDDTYADRLFAAVFSCSVNFLTGDAIVVADDIDETRELATDTRSYPLSDLGDGHLPQVCSTAYERYNDDFMHEHFSDQ